MAERNNPNRQALLKSRPQIVRNLENPDEVVDQLYAQGLFTDEMKAAVLQELEREKKSRKILDTLNYRGKNAAKGLYDAFMNTSNGDLAELLAPYIKQMQSEDNKFSPEIWPPSDEDQKKMEADPVIRITDLNSPDLHEYKNTSPKTKVYKMRNRIRGKVFIINNEIFEKKAKMSDRPGSDVDTKNLESLFTQLQFEVVIAKDRTAQDMIDFLTNERDKVNWHYMECVVLIIMSHGETNGIYGTDGKLKKLKDMTDIFNSSQCHGLDLKPRLVFVQACRGENTERGTTGHGIQETEGANQKDQPAGQMKKGGQDTLDAHPGNVTEVTQKTVHSAVDARPGNVHSATDFLIAYATPEETPAYRHTDSGSWFLNAIVWTFKYHAHKENILQLLSRVNNVVSQGRTEKGLLTVSEIKSTLRYPFFFFPGVYDNPPKLVDS